jgi:hypothetical protein
VSNCGVDMALSASSSWSSSLSKCALLVGLSLSFQSLAAACVVVVPQARRDD